ncbi:MAG: family 43 glycosylhydrolase, partial [Bacteroidota bacterium]
IGRPLDRISQLNMIGVPDSGGVWAPCLSYDQGTFYLVYSNVKTFQGVWKDTPNFLVTAKNIEGPWSEPIFLNARGFDGSLFHDKNGKKYYLSMVVDHRSNDFFGGIIAQEYDPINAFLTGPIHRLTEGTALGNTEGPHLYQKDGYYYLLLAEGGTEYGHASSVARSESLFGPYTFHPDNPIVTAKGSPEAPIQKTGHGDFVEGQNGDWWFVYLCGRPLSSLGRCTLGRETCIEQLTWEDGWPKLSTGNKLTRTKIPSATEKEPTSFSKINFDQAELDIHFQSLRIPVEDSWCSLTEHPGYLRLYGRESLSSLLEQSLIARRVQHFKGTAQTQLNFQPDNFQQMAGLVCYYNTYHWFYLNVYGDENQQRNLQIIACDKYNMYNVLPEPQLLPASGEISLQAQWDHAVLQFSYALEAEQWLPIGPELDFSILSDDYVRDEQNRYRPAFTGTFIGMCCQDLSGLNKHADFGWWYYEGE